MTLPWLFLVAFVWSCVVRGLPGAGAFGGGKRWSSSRRSSLNISMVGIICDVLEEGWCRPESGESGSRELEGIYSNTKKDGRMRCCVCFRDLNKASPKDDFPLPQIDVLVDNTTGHALLSFMDGFSRYNQRKMSPENKTKTTFTTQWGTYCYRVMPFGLKNAGATYQRAATTLFHDLIHKEVEKFVKGRIIAEQLADAPTEDAELSREFPDKGIMMIRDVSSLITWTMYFDGTANSKGKGVGIVLISPRDEHIPISIKLDFDCTNNVSEYVAYIAGLEAALSLESFHNISFIYISRLRNRFADALATLASMVDIPVGVKVRPLAIKRHVAQTHIHVVQIAARCPMGNLATPFSLTYGMDAVLPIEFKIPSLRILMERNLPESEWAHIHYQELCMMDEKMLKVAYHVQGYKCTLERAFNKKVRIRELRQGDMVLRECRASIFDPRGKFRPNRSGPYVVDEILPGKAVKLLDQNGNRIPEPTNLDQLKRYYS
ncbi:uncharacterized protein LOC143883040 [Tasmannia lanceolata]|uniref:uncharacterized protein LOC143883040 n=1 Tax=Tasmannia lanceolata TaxID=3420 RepID=UPI004062D2EE